MMSSWWQSRPKRVQSKAENDSQSKLANLFRMDYNQTAADPEKFSAAMGTQKEEWIPNIVKYCSHIVSHSLGFSPANDGNEIDG
jgi:hypothetical protein